ncbi:potassium channel family protein [uncultured Ramlibacter sp.]|uniref:potassium channel family protein n=1 Tax=uncultured Ramlibacter sp. TaxID=260755 RepID=UPI0026303F16|nr:potassium channel family protein [uncultured Ramlibacter sp.]
MNFLHRSIKGGMLVAGLLTCTMFYAAIAPEAVLQSAFGQAIDGPVAQIVVRNWGILIGLMGLLLIYGAFHEPVRRTALLVAGASKLAFISLVLALGQQFLQFQAGVSVAADVLMVALFAAYLIATRGGATGAGLQPADSDPRALQRKFVARMRKGLRVVWPILSALLMLIVALGVVAGTAEGWSLQESVYFSFVSGLTIGYGDYAPKTLLGRVLAVAVGICGILVTALIAAVAVKALTQAQDGADD